MNTKKLPLTIESDTLNAFKSDFNQMLRRLLHAMETKEAEEGTLSCKITVRLEQDQTRDYQANGYDGTREILKPTFNHKVGMAVQLKDEKSGSLGGDYEIMWDKEMNAYVMVETNNGQTSIFDDEPTEVSNPAKKSDYEAKEIIDCEYRELALPETVDDTDELDAEVDVDELVSAFKYLSRFSGEEMYIQESSGMYAVRSTKRNSVIFTSAGKGIFHIDADILKAHSGHKLLCCGDGATYVYFKCAECNEVIWRMDNPQIEDDSFAYDEPEE